MEKDKLKKAIILDCDNTLWKGIVGEEEVIPDTDLQNDIIFFAKRGIIIGLCSKNNEDDVLNALKIQTLREDYISVRRINWKDKASNLKEIAQELNIGLDAMVFVDDQEFEINLIKEQLPEVMAIYPKDINETILEWFDLSGDFTKTEQYKANYQRAKAQEQFTNIDDFLASMDMVLTIKVNDTTHLARIAELTQKTNQFNLTTFRLTERQVQEAMNYPSRTYSLSVKDKFGDNGLTGVCIIRGNTIDIFLLSCRILGRGIEYAFMDFIIEDLKKNGYKGIIGKYIASEKNIQTESFYGNCGFECINVKDSINTFTMNFNNYKKVAKNHFKYEW